ncbi:hypothetical protein Tco_0519488 [Tanacetum coccineum]
MCLSFAADQFGVFYRCIRAKVIENQSSPVFCDIVSWAVTTTFVYTDYSSLGEAFWGDDDEEISEGGIPRVIVLGYDRLPIQPVAPPSPDYIPGPEDPQTPPVPQDEDEHMFRSLRSAACAFACLIRLPRCAREDYHPASDFHIPPTRGQKVEDDFLAMTTPSPSPPISLSPPSAGERLARCTALPAHSSPLLMPNHYYNHMGLSIPYPDTQDSIHSGPYCSYYRITITSTPPSLYIPPPVDRRDDIPESEQPPRKRLYFSTLGSREATGNRDVGYGIRDTWVDPAEAVPEIAPMIVGEVNTRVTELVSSVQDTKDLYALLEVAKDETVWMVEEEAYASREAWLHSDRLSQAYQQELRTIVIMCIVHENHLRHTRHSYSYWHQDQMVETLRVIRDMRREMSDMQGRVVSAAGQQTES